MKSKNLKIFIVEDDAFFGNLIQTKISGAGYNNAVLLNNSTNFLERLLEMPDIVVLDFNIDEMNGIDLLRKIKSVNPNIHVVLLSAQHDLSVAVDSLKYGAYDYIEKNESCLNRLLNILDRINTTNEVLNKNLKLNRFKRMATLAFIATLLSIVLYQLV